jgi:hypothetical protein
LNQKSAESCGTTAKPTTTVNANPAIAMNACRNLRVSSRYGTKISGTSLMPAATPMRKPFHRRLARVSGCVRSQMIISIRTMLICPR